MHAVQRPRGGVGDMEDIEARHRKEQRDLQSQITQKKKAASKKTRKGVNAECERLEQDLKDRQAAELSGEQGDALQNTNGTPDGKSITNGHDSHPSDPEEAQAEDHSDPEEDLLASLATASLQTSTPTNDSETPSTGPTPRKPNRAKARLARRAAVQSAAVAAATKEAATFPDLKSQERTRMLAAFKAHGLVEKVVPANGHCLYLAVADQMRCLGLGLNDGQDEVRSEQADRAGNEDYKTVRARAAAYMSSHADDFEPFLEEPFEEYVRKVRETGEWGGQLELMALAKAYDIRITVLQADGRMEKIESREEGGRGEAWLAYYRHGFGLGEHYNSLRRKEEAKEGG